MFNRRQVVGGSVAVAAISTAQLASAKSGRARSTQAVDAVVIGAGFAGLTAAAILRRAGKNVVLLEALDRVGGRSKPALLAGHTVDVGGQWVGPTQTALLDLGKRYGIATEPQYVDGTNILQMASGPIRFTGDVPTLPDADMAELARAMEALETAAAQLDPTAPWLGATAAGADRFTSQHWFEANVKSRAAIDVLSVFWRAVFSVEAWQISHLYALAYVRAAGGIAQLIGSRGGAQDATFKGGVHAIARAMATELGGALHLSTPVQAVEQDKDGVVVRFASGSLSAKRVILACPPSARARIAFSPGLPAPHSFINERMPLGSVIKFLVAYPKPFWRAKGLSGQVVATEGPVKVIFDKALPDGLGGLVGFFNGADGTRGALLSKAERKRLVVEQAIRYLGPEAANPIDYVDNDWLAEPHIGGGYTSIPGPGVFSLSGSGLRSPAGLLHFAGTETSDVWPGYIDGAVRSGERVAAEILKAL